MGKHVESIAPHELWADEDVELVKEGELWHPILLGEESGYMGWGL